MCLLIVISRLDAEAPLVVAANRDERYDRPATAMTVLRARAPRILGGRDELAGGTWLSVNQHGVVAGLTNRPSDGGRDPTRHSRGELPLRLAVHPDATTAAGAARAWQPSDYNPAWLLVGDRRSLYYLDVTGEHVTVHELGPGVHILENRPLGEPSPKLDRVRALLSGVEAVGGPGLLERLRSVLQDHTAPEPAQAADGGPSAAADRSGALQAAMRPVATEAACVHLDSYGTRSSTLVRVPASPGSFPQVLSSDGPPCRSPFLDATHLWGPPAPAEPA